MEFLLIESKKPKFDLDSIDTLYQLSISATDNIEKKTPEPVFQRWIVHELSDSRNLTFRFDIRRTVKNHSIFIVDGVFISFTRKSQEYSVKMPTYEMVLLFRQLVRVRIHQSIYDWSIFCRKHGKIANSSQSTMLNLTSNLFPISAWIQVSRKTFSRFNIRPRRLHSKDRLLRVQ